MARDERIVGGPVVVMALHHMDIGAADPDPLDSTQHFERAGLRIWHLLHPEIVGCVEDERLHAFLLLR